MIAFRQRTLWESIKRIVSPSYRKRRDDAMRAAIRELLLDPSAPCIVAGTYIPNGYGIYTIKSPYAPDGDVER